MNLANLLPVLSGSGGSVVAPVAPRVYRGQMCGVIIDGLPAVSGGSQAIPGLVLSWFYTRYRNASDRARILQRWRDDGWEDILTSNQDDFADGFDLGQIVRSRQELDANGFRPCEWLSSKYYSPWDDAKGTLALMNPTLDAFLQADCISRYCVGAELNLWNTYDSVQTVTDAIAPRIVAKGRPLYVHFSPNVADWRPDHPGSVFAEYWNPNRGKLTGLLWQSDPYANDRDLQEAIRPVLERFVGYFGVTDSGFGHPFDLVGLENRATQMYNGTADEREANRAGQVVLDSPAVTGPYGVVQVMGCGNGQIAA